MQPTLAGRFVRRGTTVSPRAPRDRTRGAGWRPQGGQAILAGMAVASGLRSRGFWLVCFVLSVLLHLLALGGLAAWEALHPPAETPPEPIPVELLKTEAPEEPPEPARRPQFEFRKGPQPPRERDRLEIRPETVALAPPPVDAELGPTGSAGGLAVEGVRASALDGFTLSGEGGGRAGRGVGSGNAVGQIGTFQEYLAALRETGLDVVFAIDSTGSMGWVIAEVRSRIEDLARVIRRLVPVTRFGVVAYRDHDDPEFLTRTQPLTLDASRVRRFLGGITAGGGGDEPEAVTAALRAAVAESGWTEGARHVIIVVGDAPPHSEHLEQALETARSFRRRGGVVTAVDVSFDANPRVAAEQLGTPVDELRTLRPRGVLPEFREIARAGGGDGTSLEGERQVIAQLGLLIFGREWAEEVEPLLAEL